MNGTSRYSRLAQKPFILSLLITCLLVLWMLSGLFKSEEVAIDSHKEIPLTQVKVQHIKAQRVHDEIALYGRTAPDRITTLKAELDGKVFEVLAQRGSLVSKGQVIAHLDINDLPAQLKKNQSLLKQREIEYEGALKLNADGYQGKAKLSQSLAELDSVKADIERIEINIAKTAIRAPYSGILSERFVEEGDFVKVGGDVAVVTDLDPIIVVVHVTEKQIGRLYLGQPANIRLLNNENTQGRIRYVASVANDKTNTFKVEIEINNPDYKLLSGISSEIDILLEEVEAIKLSPALLALDEKGEIGIKTVVKNTVIFTPIQVVKSDAQSMWLKGLGAEANVIVLGQGFVRAGDKVDPVYSADKE